MREDTEYPPDATIPAPKFVIRDFVVGTSIAIIGNVTTNGSKVKVRQPAALTANSVQRGHLVKTQAGLKV